MLFLLFSIHSRLYSLLAITYSSVWNCMYLNEHFRSCFLSPSYMSKDWGKILLTHSWNLLLIKYLVLLYRWINIVLRTWVKTEFYCLEYYTFIMFWKVAGELHNPKNITRGSNSPLFILNAAFHLSPILIRTLLYPHRRSNFMKYLALLSLSSSLSTLGRGC